MSSQKQESVSLVLANLFTNTSNRSRIKYMLYYCDFGRRSTPPTYFLATLRLEDCVKNPGGRNLPLYLSTIGNHISSDLKNHDPNCTAAVELERYYSPWNEFKCHYGAVFKSDRFDDYYEKVESDFLPQLPVDLLNTVVPQFLEKGEKFVHLVLRERADSSLYSWYVLEYIAYLPLDQSFNIHSHLELPLPVEPFVMHREGGFSYMK